MKLIGNYDSPFVRRVAVALNHYQLPFERQIISVFKDFDDVLDINPLGKVPALQLDDHSVIVDSRIIIDFLEGIVSDERKLVPNATTQRIKILQIEAIAVGLAEASVGLRIELYRKKPTALDPDWIDRMEKQVTSALAWLENRKPTPWLYETTLTLPDITTVAAYTYLKNKLPNLVPEKKYPFLDQMWKNLENSEPFLASQYSETEAWSSEE